MSDCEEKAPRQHAKTVSIKRLSKRELERGRLEANADLEGIEFTRPKTRGDCLQGDNAQRPCPYVGCKHHLYLDISAKSGSLKHNFPHLEVWDLPESCALDVADRQGITLEEVGIVMNLTRERVRQLENRGLGKLKALDDICGWADLDEKQEGARDCTTDNDREHVRKYAAKANEAPRPASATQLTEFLNWLDRERADLG